jgi:hypothetical protein
MSFVRRRKLGMAVLLFTLLITASSTASAQWGNRGGPVYGGGLVTTLPTIVRTIPMDTAGIRVSIVVPFTFRRRTVQVATAFLTPLDRVPS